MLQNGLDGVGAMYSMIKLRYVSAITREPVDTVKTEAPMMLRGSVRHMPVLNKWEYILVTVPTGWDESTRT
jgi:hypothetical protein